MFDLHVHTNISDGALSPEYLMAHAAANHVTTMAIADHETIIHYDEYAEIAPSFGIELIPAIELNVSDHKDFHILGYYIKNRKNMEAKLLEIRKKNQEICFAVLQSLKKEFGIDLNPMEVVSYNKDFILDKKAIAKALIAAGYADCTKAVYDKYIGPGAKSYIPIEKMTAQKAINLIHQNGGVAVWAHPYTIKRVDGTPFTDAEFDAIAADIARSGIDGVEAYTDKHSLSQVANLERLAAQNHLLITGGSDFHSGEIHHIGCPQLTAEHLGKLKARASYFYQDPSFRKRHER